MTYRDPATRPRPDRDPSRSECNRDPATPPLQGARCTGRGSAPGNTPNRDPVSTCCLGGAR